MKNPLGVTQIILHGVESVQVGKYKLACFLKGSHAKEVMPKMHEKVYGGLFWHTIATIEGFIEQLEEKGLIKREMRKGYPYPYAVYVLTEEGKKAKEEQREVSLNIIKKEEPIRVGESEKITLELFKQGNSPSEIANLRGLVESTIYTHLYKLIVHRYLSSVQVIKEEIKNKIEIICSQFEKRPSLKEIKEKLPEEITYGEIRCVTAEYYKEGRDKNTNTEIN